MAALSATASLPGISVSVSTNMKTEKLQRLIGFQWAARKLGLRTPRKEAVVILKGYGTTLQESKREVANRWD